MTIQARMTKINQIAQSATLIHSSNKTYDHKKGKLVCAPRRSYHVNSVRDDQPYQVHWQTSIERGSLNVLVIDTKLYSFEAKHFQWQHPANTCGTIVYQVLGALKKAAKSEGKTLSFCDDTKDENGKVIRTGFENAVILLNLGGTLVKVRNIGNGVVWAVVR